jgi:translation elongation factor EF-1alpha
MFGKSLNRYCYILQDMGTVVVGKIESGKIKRGQNVLIMPNKVIIYSSNWIFISLVFADGLHYNFLSVLLKSVLSIMKPKMKLSMPSVVILSDCALRALKKM